MMKAPTNTATPCECQQTDTQEAETFVDLGGLLILLRFTSHRFDARGKYSLNSCSQRLSFDARFRLHEYAGQFVTESEHPPGLFEFEAHKRRAKQAVRASEGSTPDKFVLFRPDEPDHGDGVAYVEPCIRDRVDVEHHLSGAFGRPTVPLVDLHGD